MKSFIIKYEKTLIISISALLLTIFAYVTPPGIFVSELASLSLFYRLPGDLAIYAIRFASSFILFGLIPLAYVAWSGKSLSSMGMKRADSNPFKDWFYIALIPFCLAIGFISSKDSALAEYYPYSKTLSQWAYSGNWRYLFYHIFSYSLFYYLPWEIFFRGFLIFSFLNGDIREKEEISPSLLMIASLQVIPSSIIHFGHPMGETIGAIPFGILCGWLVLKYRSVFPGLLLHIITGISLDIFITLDKGGII